MKFRKNYFTKRNIIPGEFLAFEDIIAKFKRIKWDEDFKIPYSHCRNTYKDAKYIIKLESSDYAMICDDDGSIEKKYDIFLRYFISVYCSYGITEDNPHTIEILRPKYNHHIESDSGSEYDWIY